MANHIFISYSRRQDQAYASKLADELRRQGFEVWWDRRIPTGDEWWPTIEQAIRECAAFVVVMTPGSERSRYVRREILLAERSGKPIFPLLLRSQVFGLLIDIQYEDVTGGQLPADAFYERLEREGVPRERRLLVGTVCAHCGQLNEPRARVCSSCGTSLHS